MKKFLEMATIVENEAIIPEVWKMVFHAPQIAREAQPGQFVNVHRDGGQTFLRRPFGIVDADTESGNVTIIYRLVGIGTAEMTTDDGSQGIKGFAVDALPQIFADQPIDRVSVCGPTVMMKTIAQASAKAGVACEVSMEKRMACGIGVCLGCTFESKLRGKRDKVCADGPVFDAKEVFA